MTAGALEKNSVILINFLPSVTSDYRNEGSIYPSTAILLIGTILKQDGFDVKIFDGALDADFESRVAEYVRAHPGRICYVGMSVMTTQVPFAYRISKRLKAIDPELAIVWGGPHPTLFPRQTLADPCVDVVVVNEGAFTALEIARAMREESSLAPIKGLGYKDGRNPVFTEAAGIEPIDRLPHLDFSLIDIEQYLDPPGESIYQREFPQYREKVRILPIVTGLGCPYRCQFCINVILKRYYRFRNAASIIEEIKRLQEAYNANSFIFFDEDFFINKRRVFEFVDLVEREGLHFNWRMWCRVDHFKPDFIDRELLRRMAAIGHGSLVMGGESGNQEILDALKKMTTTGQILNSLRMLDDTRINPRYSFIVGFENETIAQIKNTFRFCLQLKKIRPDVDIAPFVFRLYPGSIIFDRLCARYRIDVPRDVESWESFIIREETFSKLPWTPKRFQKNVKYTQYYAPISLCAPSRARTMSNQIKKIRARVGQFRLKHFLFAFPFEYWLSKLAKALRRHHG
ncbi:MAG: B12-binding domain-containing radical SAM protein [Proteobacteria bacterium]|nr:B12-binding domain-containing radical SAM protein [Pseudomonadota bacterium]